MEDSPLPDHGVHQVVVSVKLVLDNVVQHLKQEKHQMMISLIGNKEPGCGECFNKMDQFASSSHRHGFDIGRYVAQDGEEAVK